MKINKVVILIMIVLIAGGVYYFQQKSPTPSATIQPTQVIKNDLSQEEKDQIMAESHKIVKNNSMPNLKYSLAIKKHVGNYVRVDVTPAPGEQVDPARVVLEKKGDMWEATAFGTSFPDLEQKLPELFN